MKTEESATSWERLASGDRRTLARAISLCESSRQEQRRLASELVTRALADERARGVARIGVTGPAGVGKSTLLDVLGRRALAEGKCPAVLAIDPSSRTTGGSLLGDQTRMARLIQQGAFVRPSPTRGHLGGAAAHTVEAAWLCAAAGFTPVFIETVGVGQNESEVSDLVDLVVVLLQPGAGDELQGMKRGLLEHADLLVVAQADGERLGLAEETRCRFEAALRLRQSEEPVPVALLSALEGRGVDELWKTMGELLEARRAGGGWQERRQRQQVAWFRSALREELLRSIEAQGRFGSVVEGLEVEVGSGVRSAPQALRAALAAFGWDDRDP